MTKPLTLYLYALASTHNPTIPGLNRAFQAREDAHLKVMDVSTSTSDEIRKAMQSASSIVLESMVLDGRISPSGKSQYIAVHGQQTAEHYRQILDYALLSESQLFLLAGNYDLHSRVPGNLNIEEMSRFNGIIWPYVDPPKKRSEVRSSGYWDEWMNDKEDPFEIWQLVKKFIPRQIEYTHAIEPTEVLRSEAKKIWDVCVPGELYSARKIALASAREAGLSIAPYRSIDQMLRKSTAAAAMVIDNRRVAGFRFQLRHRNMTFAVKHSASNFVCGTGNDFFVRKFLEVPAAGSVLVAHWPPGMGRFGFKHGVHYLESKPEEFASAANWVRGGSKSAAQLGANARSLLLAHHTFEARSGQLLGAISKFADGSANSARFHEGELICE